MAIVQISKIQHRRGVNTDLPQLASAELGWSVDTRQLYIGNGTLNEGAPQLGNTEILTEYSDLLALTEAYTFKGAAAGYIVVTGDPLVSRSFQQKLDDFVNIRDFGVVGDGVTDVTEAINHAFAEIYCREDDATIGNLSRRTIFFPGGVYKVTDLLKIPTWAKLQGDGIDSTVIVQTNASVGFVATAADGQQQIQTNIGEPTPQSITISDLSFKNQTSNHVFELYGAKNIIFNRVGFSSVESSLTSAQFNKGCVVASAPGSIIPTKNIEFNSCRFSDQTYAFVNLSSNVFDITFTNCSFYNLYRAFNIGENYTMKNIRVVTSQFDNIASSAIVAYTTTNIISSGNHYSNVGNNLIALGAPSAPVLDFGNSNGSYSIGDIFDRTDANDLIQPRVATVDQYNIVVNSRQGVRVGNRTIGMGVSDTLYDSTTVPTSTGIVLQDTTPGATIRYCIRRSFNGDLLVRDGTLVVSHSPVGVTFEDNYTENGDMGVVFSVVNSGETATVYYTMTSGSPGDNATVKFSIDKFSY